jgi:hypothetical protein
MGVKHSKMLRISSFKILKKSNGKGSKGEGDSGMFKGAKKP